MRTADPPHCPHVELSLSRPFRVGLTGGIACGKTEVAKRFAELGVPIIDTDQIARILTVPGTPIFNKIVARFGPEILDEDGAMDRRRMRERIFQNEPQRRLLESILHPAIRTQQEQLAAKAGGPYQIHVVPLLAESRTTDRYDRILVVDCPRAVQLQRLLNRDRVDLELADRILNSQVTRDARLAIADDVLENAESLAELTAKISTLHNKYLELAGGHRR